MHTCRHLTSAIAYVYIFIDYFVTWCFLYLMLFLRSIFFFFFQIINFYMNLLMERSQKNVNYPKVYAFNTFFYPKLSKSGYHSVRRWTKKVSASWFHTCIEVLEGKSLRLVKSLGKSLNHSENSFSQEKSLIPRVTFLFIWFIE